ncbi:MAG: hypothetical protein A2V99_12435 [Spirochaetes bacterium RBG_16_67_19]|nr:MAG: hypothetical protein A2V99_12435 [Spirochaetes bacterium RBG_16_67_19]
MNKKLNTALFMLAATIFNLVLLLLFVSIGWVVVGALFREHPQVGSILLIVVFLAAMVGSFLIYNQVVKLITRKIDMEKYFLPLFKRRPPRKDGPQS